MADKMKLDITKVQRKLRTACQKGHLAAAQVLANASRELVPVDTGTLKASCEVEADEKSGSVSYNTDYAVVVHERPIYHATGQYKYLETPANDSSVQASMLSALADAVREDME